MGFPAHSKRLLRLFAIAAIAGAMVGVPGAPAKSGASVQLSVLPLPASSLGSGARSLPLQRDSGVIDNTSYWGWTIPLYPNRWNVYPPDDPATKLGRVSGYALDYGHGASGGAGITEVWTSVDEYQTSGDATKGLRYWRRLETNGLLESAVRGVLSATTTKEKPAAVGNRRFAVLAAYRAKNIARLFGLDEQFTVGRYVAEVTVWAGSAAKAKKLAPKLAKKLHARIKQALAGTLHAKPVKLPPSEGSPGGPDLAPLGLKTTDLNGQASYTWRGYEAGPVPFSIYHVQMAPAGQFHQLDQEIFWYPTANEARFNDDYYERPKVGSTAIPIDLSSVGDGAWGYLQYYKMPGGIAELFFSSGRIDEQVFLQGTPATPIQASQAENLAPIVASYIDAAGLGSGAIRHQATFDASSAGEAPTCTAPCRPPVGVGVGKNGTGSGTVSSVPAGIDCGPICWHGYPCGLSVTLTATPAAGSAFTGWSGFSCTGAGTTCNVVAGSGAGATATFTLLSHLPNTLSVSMDGNGYGTVSSTPAGIACPGGCVSEYPWVPQSH